MGLLKRIEVTPCRVALAACVLALLVRVAFILTLEEKWYFYDTKHYDAAARSLLRGEGFTLQYEFFNSTAYNLEPVYPLFLAAHYGVFGRVFLAVRLTQAILGTLLCTLVYLIGTRVFGAWQGVIAAGVCALYPHLIFISGLLYPEQLFTTLLAAGILFSLKFAETRRTGDIVWGAFFLGAATLTKGILLVFLPVAGVWLFFALNRSRMPYRMKRIAIFYGVIIIILMPWTLRNYKVVGKLTPVRAHTNIILDEKYVDRDDALLTRLINKKISVGHFLICYGGEFVRFWTPTLGRLKSSSEFKTQSTEIITAVATIPVMIMAMVGVLISRSKMRGVLLFLALIFSFAFTYAMFITHVRYRIPVEPYLILLAGSGVVGTVQYISSRKG